MAGDKMEISSVNQAYVFLAMVLCGALCTAVFDIFRAIRRYKNSGTGVIAFQDIIFWIIELFIVYMVAFRLNYARVRAYEIIALVIGSGIYFVTLSDYVIKFLVWIIGMCVRVVNFLVSPFVKLFGFIESKFRKVICFVKNKCTIVSVIKSSVNKKLEDIGRKVKDGFGLFKAKHRQNSAPKDNKLQN